MPKIVKAGGVNISGEVFKVRDSVPIRRAPPPKPQAVRMDEVHLTDPNTDGDASGNQPAADAMAYAPEMEQDFQPMQGEIIQGAMSEASRILEEAVRAAENSRAEILAEAGAEAERLRNEAAEQGRRQGLSSVVGEMRTIAEGVEGTIAQFEGERAGFEAEFEEQLKWLAIEIASKVLAKKVSLDDSEMLEMVDKAVRGVQSEPWVRVEIAQEMSRLVSGLRELYDAYTNIEVTPMRLPPGTVHIETPSGIVDASLRTQLDNLKTYFEKAGS